MVRILIADDERLTRLQIKEMLTGLGYEVVGQAESGREAIELARDLRPDLILMDVVMPGETDGIDAGAMIKAQQNIPIIFVSGYGDPQYIERAKHIEPFGYVMKPFDEKEVRASVEIALYGREMELKLRHANDQLKQINRELECQISDRKETLDRFLLLLDSLDAAVYVSDMETYEILFINKYVKNLFGNRVGDLCWQAFHDGQSGPCEFCTNNRLIAASGEPTGPIVWDHYNPKAGGWWEIRDQAIKWPDGRMVRLEIALDISRRKQTEESLEISRERLMQIIDFLPDATFVIDTEGKVVAWNHAIEKMTGIRAKDMLGKGDFEYAVPFYGKRRPILIDLVSRWDKEAEAAYNYVKKEGDALVSETYNCLVKPGGTLWNKASLLYARNGEVTGAIESIRDITERKAYEEALRESEKRYRSLFEQVKSAIVLTTSRGDLVDANTYALDLFGYTKEEMMSVNFQRLYVNPDDGQRFRKEMEESGSVQEFSARLRRSDGLEMDCRMDVVNRHGEMGKVVGYQGIIRDVTESNRLQMQLQEARKTEAIATLAGGIAHQFNNALTPIIGNLDLIEMEYGQDDKMMKALKHMKASSRRMARLTRQLLAYAREGKYQVQVLSLPAFVLGTIPLIEHTLKPDVCVETDLPEDLSCIKAEATQMQMVLSALIANANEAMEGPGRIRIWARNMDLDAQFVKDHPGLDAGPYVCLSVDDTGKGMDKETQDRVFDPFFTTHFLGRGLGMSAVYGIIKNHGGAIKVGSEPGKGTQVRIYLPAVSAERREQGASDGKTPEVETIEDEKTVLVIEDEELVMDLAQAMLERLGYRVLKAATGKEAVHTARTFEGGIDLALLDIKLPDMTGIQVYPLIMAARPGLKVVVCSGYSIDGPAREILNSGALGFIQKPFSLEALNEKLRQVLQKQ